MPCFVTDCTLAHYSCLSQSLLYWLQNDDYIVTFTLINSLQKGKPHPYYICLGIYVTKVSWISTLFSKSQYITFIYFDTFHFPVLL